MAPTGIMATAALQSNRAAASAMPDDSSTDSAHSHESKGVAGESYFLPGAYLASRCAADVIDIEIKNIVGLPNPRPSS